MTTPETQLSLGQEQEATSSHSDLQEVKAEESPVPDETVKEDIHVDKSEDRSGDEEKKLPSKSGSVYTKVKDIIIELNDDDNETPICIQSDGNNEASFDTNSELLEPREDSEKDPDIDNDKNLITSLEEKSRETEDVGIKGTEDSSFVFVPPEATSSTSKINSDNIIIETSQACEGNVCIFKVTTRQHKAVSSVDESNATKRVRDELQRNITKDHGDHEPSIDENELKRRNMYEEAKGKFTYFWKTHDVFSQWHESKFSADGIEFSCAEQYMMYRKAKLFESDDIAKQILETTEPRRMKALGRKVKQFKENTWCWYCLDVVKDASKYKFSQNPKMKEELFKTYPTVLVEASPYDRIWGIGLEKDDERAWDEWTWQGLNLLGYILTEVRDELMYDERHITYESKRVFTTRLQEELFRLNVENDPGTYV